MAGGRVLNTRVFSTMLLIFFLFFAANAQELTVNTTEGIVAGTRAPDGNYFVFYDVPYAGPTSGENRFKAPIAPSPRQNVFQAINRNTICAQPSQRGLIGTEDCLTLSIYTQNVTTPKPVFVWLNAEEYTTTPTSLISYKRLVEEGIVFVTLNFRVSVFGFLCLRVPDAPGNAGLKDIIQGLTWLKANIANFGGQPGNIILIGHASGAALVDLITMTPKAGNLVHKAVALSGSALAPWAVAYDPIGYAKMLGVSLSYTNKANDQLAKLMKKTDINVLISALSNFKFTNSTPLFAPCIENDKLNSNDTILTDAPINLLKSGKFLQIPYITGYTTREGTLRAEEAVASQWLEKMQANFSKFLPVDLGTRNLTELANSIRKFYFNEKAIDMGTIEDYLEYYGDTLVLVPTIRAVKERGATSTQSVRLLEFGYRGTQNSDWLYHQIPLSGARHGSFLNYLFDYDLRPADEFVRKSLVKRFITFANTGDPNAPDLTTWNTVTNDSFNYLLYRGISSQNDTSKSIEEARINPHVTRMTFWNETFSKYYVPPPASSAARTMSVAIILILCQLFVRFA